MLNYECLLKNKILLIIKKSFWEQHKVQLEKGRSRGERRAQNKVAKTPAQQRREAERQSGKEKNKKRKALHC